MSEINLKNVFLTQVAIIIACAFGIYLTVPVDVKSFLAGGLLSLINFGLLAWLWKGVLDKKPVARSLIIIVTKYAILGLLLYVFIRRWNLPVIPLLVGLSTLAVSLLLVALKNLRTI